jgi:hypothetical protein
MPFCYAASQRVANKGVVLGKEEKWNNHSKSLAVPQHAIFAGRRRQTPVIDATNAFVLNTHENINFSTQRSTPRSVKTARR